LVTLGPGAKKLVVALVVIFVLFFVISQPQQSADLVKNILGMLQSGAESLVTFLRSLFA
jgi:preprotein translocase subunit YajC